ncbi:Rieske (2Fe-2S) domain protein [Rhizorhabdus wittichii RW1]|uniref:Rieske (2Fe-2S) domain protein n=1 Tax=Rhizorhabdus wittichii (strain DSM 6014 / CCUG 31198 / JCM 15750 / NBRC 105917 / EY 4224 / RW1) TaxID=392499 RepID=A0A9J9HBB4_RHIWR|nr:Rieske (2Fe-2S) domain protein [Rhizorhabdus wittichii RW1]
MANYWFNSKLGYAPPDWFSTFGNIDPGSPVKPPEFRRLMPLSRPDADYDLGSNAETWSYFWHPVATLAEFQSHSHTGRGPMATRLLDRQIVLVELDGKVQAFDDRCPHRSASLGLGVLDKGEFRCRYHGWRFDAAGRCTDIPSMEEGQKVPGNIRLTQFDCDVRYDLIWVRLKSGATTEIPHFPAWDDPTMTSHMGAPYLWPVSSGRRVANFTDVTHLPFGHKGTLGGPPYTRFKAYPIAQHDGMLEFQQDQFIAYNPGDATFGPPTGPESIMLPPGGYQVVMPFTVMLFFDFGQGRFSQIMMHPTPIDAENCRSYWITSHTTDSSATQEHLSLQSTVLTEDIAFVSSQNPRALSDEAGEMSVKADKPEIIWRRWLKRLIAAAAIGPAEIDRCLAETGTH